MSDNPVNRLIAQQGTRYQTATAYVADVLREAIVTGVIKEGEPLGQEELGARFRVSRAPIREALRLLEAQGLVESLPHRGSRVASLKKDEMVEIFEIRAALEALALRRSVPALTESMLDTAARLLKEMEAQTDIDRYIDLHRRFHLTLYSQAGSRLLALINQQFDAAERYLRIEVTTLESIKRAQGNHAKLLQACRRGDVEAAVAYVSDVAKTGDDMFKSLNEERRKTRPRAAARRSGGNANTK